MKKIFILLFIILKTFTFAVCVSAESGPIPLPCIPTRIFVNTPNGTQIEAFNYNCDMTPEQKLLLTDDAIVSQYNYEILDEPTFYYNCHSFAWYFRGYNLPQSSLQSCWIDNPIDYILDGSYVEENLNQVSEGDIITYWNDDKLMHSGLVVKNSGIVDVTSLETIYVYSKLGYGPLVEHFATNVEYYNVNTTIKFYKYSRTHIHVYHSCTSISGFKHTGLCRICYKTITESHTLYKEGVFYKCTSCNYKELYKPVIINGFTYYLLASDDSQTPMTSLELRTYLSKVDSEYKGSSFVYINNNK